MLCFTDQRISDISVGGDLEALRIQRLQAESSDKTNMSCSSRGENRTALQVAEDLEKKLKLMLDNEELPCGVEKEDVEMHLRAKLNKNAPMASVRKKLLFTCA